MADQVLEWALRVNANEGTAELKKVTNYFDKVGEQGERAGKRGGKGLDSLFGKTIKLNQALELAEKAYRALAGPIGNIIKTASDAEEISSKFYAVFKAEAPAAIEWIQKFSGDVGRSKTEVMGWMSTLQDTFVPLGFARDRASEMSQTLTRLAVDLSSFNNVAEADAIADLQSAIVGNHETMRKYGVIINETVLKQELLNMGIKGGGQAATEAEKAQARLNIILRGTADAQGDAIRTADSFANRMRSFNSIWTELKEVAGKAIIEAIMPSMQKLAEWIDRNREKIEAFAKKAGEKIGEFLQIIGKIIAWLYKSRDELIYLGKVIAVVFAAKKLHAFGKGLTLITEKLGGVLKGLGNVTAKFRALRNEGNSVFKSLGGSIGGVGGKLGGLKGALGNLGPIAAAAFVGWEIGTLINDVTGLQKATAQLHKEEMKLAFMRAEKKAGITEYAQNIRKVRESILDLGKDIGVASNRLSIHAQAIFKNKEVYNNLTNEQRKMVDGFVQAGEKIKLHTEAVKKAKEAEEKLEEQKRKATEALKAEGAEVDKLIKKFGFFGGSVSDLHRETRILEKALDKVGGQFYSSLDPIKKVEKEVDRLKAAYIGMGEKVPPILEQITKKTRDAKIQLIEVLEPPKLNTKRVFEDITKGLNQFANSANASIETLYAVGPPIMMLTGKWLPELVQKTENTKEGLENVKEETESLGQAFTNLAQISKQIIGALEKMGVVSEKTAGALSGLTAGIAGIGAGMDAIKNAGKGFLGFLGKLSGGLSIVSGAFSILSSVISLFSGKSGELEAAERRLSGLIGVSGEWAEKIEALAKELGGAASAERAFNALLPEIIRNTDITTRNFDAFIRKTREIISVMEWGGVSAEETARNFGAAFNEMVNAAQALGLEGGHDMTGLILLAEEFHLEVKEIAEYIDRNMKEAFSGWKDYIAGEFSDQTLPVFDEMLRLEEQIANNEALIKGIEGAAKALEGLSNTTRLTEVEFQTFENIATDALRQLETQGITGRDALIHMKPLLEKLAFLQEQYGFALDESTQAMVDQAREQGILAESTQADQKTTNELLALIAEQLGVTIPGHLRSLVGIVDQEVGSMISKTSDWKNSIDLIESEIGDVGDAMSDLDDRWTEHVSGNTIIAENIKWLDSLAEIEGKIYEIGDTVTWFDQEYQIFTRNIDTTTRQNAIARLEEMRQVIEQMGIDHEVTLEEMAGKIAYYSDSLDTLADTLGIIIPDSLDTLQDRWNYVFSQMASDTEALYLGPDGVLRNILDTLSLIGQQTAAQIGSKYGVYTQAEKEAMTIEFSQMGHLWGSSRDTILSSEANMRSFLNDLERLVVIDEAKEKYDRFLASMRQWYSHLQAGETWDGSQWIKPTQAARGANFIVPPGFDDTFPIRAKSGEWVQIYTPEETAAIMSVMNRMKDFPVIPAARTGDDSKPFDPTLFTGTYSRRTSSDTPTIEPRETRKDEKREIVVAREGDTINYNFYFPKGTSGDDKDEIVKAIKEVIRSDHNGVTGYVKEKIEEY